MFRPIAPLLLSIALAVGGCTPSFNWRETPIESTRLKTMMPCKPDLVTRQLVLGGQATEIAMRSCKAGGATFAVAHGKLAQPDQAASLLASWRASLQASVDAATGSVDTGLAPQFAKLPQAMALHAIGKGIDGRPLVVRGLWFAADGQVFAALLYAESLAPEVAETFFSGLRMQ